MIILKQINQLKSVHHAIEEEKTGTPEELACRLNISKRRLFDILDEFKDMDAPIAYSRSRHTYYYTQPIEVCIEFSLKVLPTDEKQNI